MLLQKAGLWLIDPNDVDVPVYRKVEVIKEKAATGCGDIDGKVAE